MIRVRYRASELGDEGVVEEIPEANGYVVHEDNTLELREVWEDDDGHRKFTKVGVVHRDRWDSAVVVEDAEAD